MRVNRARSPLSAVAPISPRSTPADPPAARFGVRQRHRETGPGALLVAGLVLLIWISAVILLLTGLIGDSADPLLVWMETWGTPITYSCGAVACLWRARRSARPWPWGWAAVACLLWAYANTYYALVISPAVAPIPSPLDIGYTLFPVALGAAIVAFAHVREVRITRSMLLDATIVGVGTAALASALIFSATPVHTASLESVITTLFYPVEDIVVLAALMALGSMLGWRMGRDLVLFAAGVLSITVGDSLAVSSVLGGGTTAGAWTNLSWTLGIALIALAARLQEPDRSPRPRAAAAANPGLIIVPVGFGALLVGLLVLAGLTPLPRVVLPLAGLGLLVILARLRQLFGDTLAMAESHRLSMTCDLTGLPNRRQLMRDLRAACDRGDTSTFALFDLDGFKGYNDGFGHLAGDELLRELAAASRFAAGGSGTVYRLGGDEFCLLAPGADPHDDLVDRVRAAFRTERGEITFTASVGSVVLPREAGDPVGALRLADRRMYAQKARRPGAARRQVSDALINAIGVHQDGLSQHTHQATDLVIAVARRLGLPEEAIDDVARAAELHDVGKLAIPQEILNKPGPLDDQEWEVMKRHTVLGDEMLRAVPALSALAPLVRASHERWDGGGYPDGLAGEAIPLGARIVAVCDAFDAMVSDRAYRAGRPATEAIAELRRCAGSQFDPAVVDAFVSLHAGARPEPTQAASAHAPKRSRRRGTPAGV